MKKRKTIGFTYDLYKAGLKVVTRGGRRVKTLVLVADSDYPLRENTKGMGFSYTMGGKVLGFRPSVGDLRLEMPRKVNFRKLLKHRDTVKFIRRIGQVRPRIMVSVCCHTS